MLWRNFGQLFLRESFGYGHSGRFLIVNSTSIVLPENLCQIQVGIVSAKSFRNFLSYLEVNLLAILQQNDTALL